MIHRHPEPAAPLFAPTDPNVRAEDLDRLTGQNRTIYERLQRGPATNAELSQLSLKYTSRVSDIRNALWSRGQTVKCQRMQGGVCVYSIAKIGEEGRAA